MDRTVIRPALVVLGVGLVTATAIAQPPSTTQPSKAPPPLERCTPEPVDNKPWRVRVGVTKITVSREDNSPDGLTPLIEVEWSPRRWGLFASLTRYTDVLVPDSGPAHNVTLTTVLTGARTRWHPISPVTVSIGGGLFAFKQHDHLADADDQWSGGVFADAVFAVELWRSDRVATELFNRISLGGVPLELLGAAVWGVGVAWY